jgi:hypothetical protein
MYIVISIYVYRKLMYQHLPWDILDPEPVTPCRAPDCPWGKLEPVLRDPRTPVYKHLY